MKPHSLLAGLVVAAGPALLGASAAQAATVLYTDTFSSSPVTAGGLSGIDGFEGGIYHNATTGGAATGYALSLSGLAAHSMVTISFALAMVDSWDGTSPWGFPFDEYFNVTADGANVFRISVDNYATGSVELVPAGATGRVSGSDIFGNVYMDTVFSVAFSFAHAGPTLDLGFFAEGTGWQGGTDESWAIDTLTVSSDAVPATVPLPAALPLLGAGLAGLALLRRRRRQG